MLARMERGGAMAETVAVLGFILSLLFGTSEIVLAGYYQLQLDMATFLYSHSFALINSVPSAQLKSVLPIVPSSQVITAPSAPPNTEANDANGLSVLNEYTTGGVIGGPQNSLQNRYGGASIIRPQQIASTGTLTLPILDQSVFNNPITMTSGNIEGRAMVANHDDDSPGYDYNSAASAGNLKFPTATLGSSGDDQNVAPYYFTMSYMKQCGSSGSNYFDCAGQGTHLLALGLAEYLKDVSHAGATNGNYSIATNGVGINQQFYAMTCHQRFFAQIAALVAGADASYAAAASDPTHALQNYAVQATQYDFDLYGVSVSSGDYGAQYPQHPLAVCP